MNRVSEISSNLAWPARILGSWPTAGRPHACLFLNEHLSTPPPHPCPVSGTLCHHTGGAQLPLSRGALEAVTGLSPGSAISGSVTWAVDTDGSGLKTGLCTSQLCD